MSSTIDAAPSVASAAGELRARLGPERVLVSGALYDQARRIWNGAVDHEPALIVRAETAAEVRAAVMAGRCHHLPVSVRGGGHDWAGRALRPGGLVIDLTGMRQVAVDTETRTATVGGGATAREVIAAAAPYGLVAATGTCGSVGMAELTLVGGYGPLNGRFGLALDNLLAAEAVLADGRLVTVDAAHEPELFWAIRGGGGNFGVVTSIRVRLHPAPRLLAGFIEFAWEQAAGVWDGLRAVLADAPDELTVQSGILPGLHGAPRMFLFPVWSGEAAPGEGAGGEGHRRAGAARHAGGLPGRSHNLPRFARPVRPQHRRRSPLRDPHPVGGRLHAERHLGPGRGRPGRDVAAIDRLHPPLPRRCRTSSPRRDGVR